MLRSLRLKRLDSAESSSPEVRQAAGRVRTYETGRGAHRLVVKDGKESLTTTSVATGLNFPEFTVLDSNGAQYTIQKVTEFGRKSALLDMGTSQFRVFLELKTAESPASQRVNDWSRTSRSERAVFGICALPRKRSTARNHFSAD